jgi:paraquat-inducible protein A
VETVACHECDLLQHVPELPPGGKAKCSRCGSIVASRPSASIDRALALTVTAAIVFILAHTTSLMGLSAVGRSSSTTIFGGVLQMWEDGERITAVIVLFCAGIAPGTYITFLLTVLLAVRRPPAPLWVGELMRWSHHMQPWSMNEVMILGILVALIKIAELATVTAGIGVYAMGGLVVLFPAIALAIDEREVWERIEWANGREPHRFRAHDASRGGASR